MGSSQSKPKAQASAVQQPPGPSNDHLRTQVNYSSSISSAMDTTGSVRHNRSIENQGPRISTGVRGSPSLISPVDSHGTSTALATEPYQTSCGRSYESKHQLLLPEGKEHSNKGHRFIGVEDIYHQGDTVFKKDLDVWRAYKVERFELHPRRDPDSILVHSYFLGFDKTGKWLVPELAVLVVPFSSKRFIEELDVIPGQYFDDHHSLRQKLIERGRQYADYAGGVFYREYMGDSWPTTLRKDPIKVIVDYTTASRHGQDSSSAMQCIKSGMCCVCNGERVQLQSYPKGAPHDPDICRRDPESFSQTEQDSKNDDSLLFCPPKLWAFSMSHRDWKMVLPNHLVEVQRQGEAIGKLCMMDNHKACLVSMLSHLDAEKGIKSLDTKGEKRRGLNILLTGNTGTGKTFTVETLAEKFGVPLYKITCGDLGSDLDIIELKFNEALLRAANWGAILLLDEADIFVTRSMPNTPPKFLVSIFLRQLERSECVFFMAARISNGLLDGAIQSRLHLALRLPDLTFKGQKKVWDGCIQEIENLRPEDKQKLDDFIENDLEVMENGEFSKLNGRQIINCVTAALAVALNRETTLNRDHIEMMLKLGKEFKESLSKGSQEVAVARNGTLSRSRA